MSLLKLIALDAEDLAVVSAHLQDAVLKVGDMAYQPGERRFAALVRRFDWDKATTQPEGALERRQSALRIERVQNAQLSGIDLKNPSEVLSLLAIRFAAEHAEDPKGTIMLQFSGGAAIRLVVECIEVELRDLGAAWRARAKPKHSENDTQ